MRLSIVIITSGAPPLLSPACCVVDAAGHATGSCVCAASSIERIAPVTSSAVWRRPSIQTQTHRSVLRHGRRCTIRLCQGTRKNGEVWRGGAFVDADSSSSGGQRPGSGCQPRQKGRGHVFADPTSQSGHRHLPSFEDRLGGLHRPRTKRYPRPLRSATRLPRRSRSLQL
jgi:hypothetical protein